MYGMRSFSIFLLLANILAALSLHSESDESRSAPISLIHPEKIELLPAKVACFKWEKLVGPVVQYARAEIPIRKSGQNHVTEIPGGEVTVHWVHIPPLRNARATAKQIEQLEKSGISYLHVQENTNDPWHNAISLAILLDASKATALIEELKGKGVERVINSEQTWEQFEFEIRSPTAQMTEAIQQLARRFSETKLEITECSRL